VTLYQVIRTEGWGGLYSGLKPSLLGTAASQVFSFQPYHIWEILAIHPSEYSSYY